jgi:hypothetical protein
MLLTFRSHYNNQDIQDRTNVKEDFLKACVRYFAYHIGFYVFYCGYELITAWIISPCIVVNIHNVIGMLKWNFQILISVFCIVFITVCRCEKRLLALSCPSVRMEQLGTQWTD